METNTYGKLLSRVKAVLLDGIVIMMLGAISSTMLSGFENVPDSLRLIIFLFIFFLYDPIFTSTAGGTIGHLIIGLRVRRDSDESKKILFPYALFRFLIKAFLGWISLLTVSGSKKNKAIHDTVAGSVVLDINDIKLTK